jgi:hypothetical protein
MAQYDTIVQHDIEGAGLEITPLLLTWTQTVKIFNFNPVGGDEFDAANFDGTSEWLVEGFMQLTGGDIPIVGSHHPKYPEATCQRVSITPINQDDTTGLAVRIQWAKPGAFSQVNYDTALTQESRNYDYAGNLCECRYDPGAAFSGSVTTQFDLPFIASIRVPYNSRSMQVTQYENLENEEAVPAVAIEGNVLLFNSDTIWGFAPGQLLYIGRRASNEGTRLHRTQYYFLVNTREGFAHAFASYQNASGLVPRDVVPYIADFDTGTVPGVNASDPSIIYPGSSTWATAHPLPSGPSGVTAGTKNGSSAFKMHNSVEFSAYFNTGGAGTIKPPFNK